MHIHAEANPVTMQFKNIKIGTQVPIKLTAFNWIEVATEIHVAYRDKQTPPAVSTLLGRIFEALTPEDYRKALEAEYVEAQEKAMANHPLMMIQKAFNGGDDGPQIWNPEDATD